MKDDRGNGVRIFELSLSHWGVFEIELDNVDYYLSFIVDRSVTPSYLGAWFA